MVLFLFGGGLHIYLFTSLPILYPLLYKRVPNPILNKQINKERKKYT